MIDVAARKRFLEDTKTKTLVEGMGKAMLDTVMASTQKSQAPSLVIKHEEDTNLVSKIDKLSQAIVMIYQVIRKPLVLPKVFQVKGQVEVNQPVRIENLRELEKYFTSLEKTFNNIILAVQAMPQPQIKLPKIEVPAQVHSDLSPRLESLIESLNNKIDVISSPKGAVSMSKTEKLLESLVSKPTFTPQPVTHISLNPLQGLIKTTSQTVGTTLTTVPSYGQLFNRRAVQIFNNSNNTIYIGGSDVTVNNGIPVLANSYSSIVDAGYNMILYAVASQGGNNIRVLEVAEVSVGGTAIQE